MTVGVKETHQSAEILYTPNPTNKEYSTQLAIEVMSLANPDAIIYITGLAAEIAYRYDTGAIKYGPNVQMF